MLQVPHGELHAAGAGQSVRDPDSGLERRGADPRDGLRPARHRGRREAGQGAQTGAQGVTLTVRPSIISIISFMFYTKNQLYR